MALPVNNTQILRDLEESFLQVQEMEMAVKTQAFQKGVSPGLMRYADGTSVMAPLIAIKVQCLSTMYLIRKELEGKDADPSS
jgi:hypothetical protein